MEEVEIKTDVLLVEDNPYDAELTIDALRQGNKDMHLLHLKDGAEALDFIFGKKDYQNNPVRNDLKLIILDVKLPRLDGLEVLRKIREDERTKTLPVVILTSARERLDIQEAYKLGVNSFVVKPVGFDNYRKIISTLAYYWSVVNEKPLNPSL